MRAIKLMIAVVVLGCISNVSLAQELQTYTLESYPTDADNCDDEATIWAQKLTRFFGVSIFQTECSETSSYGYEGYDIEISFTSSNPLPRETVLKDALYGSYPDADECNDELSDQIDLFQAQTGLSVFAGYCSPAGYLFIRAFGESDIKRRLYKSHLGGEYRVGEVLIEDPDATADEIAGAVSSLGATVANLQLRSGRVYLYYYAPQKLNLQFTQFTAYSGEDDCNSEKANITQIVSTFNGEAIFQLCASTDRYPVPQKSLFTLIAMPYPFFWPQIYQLYLEDAPGTYDDLDECLGDRSRVERFYEQNLGRDVYGSTCSYRHEQPRKYMIKIFRSVQ